MILERWSSLKQDFHLYPQPSPKQLSSGYKELFMCYTIKNNYPYLKLGPGASGFQQFLD